MAQDSFKVKNSINIEPKTSPSLTQTGDIGYNSTSNEFEVRDNAATRSLVTDDGTQTLTNKTLDGASNTFTNIPSSALDLADDTTVNVATSNSNSTVNIGTGSGTNTINLGGANTTVNITGTVNNQNVTNLNVTDKLVTFNKGGAAGSGGGSGFEVEENAVATGYVKVSTGRTGWEFKSPSTAGVATLTTGASADAVVLAAATQTLTNKDIDGGTASNSNRVTLPKDTKTNLDALTRKQGTIVYDTTTNKPYYDNGTALKAIGSGSGGTKNYIEGGDAEAGTTGWATYADTAGTSPVDGTGGSANVTWTTSSSSPLSGSNSFLLTKDAANRQGQGASYDFTIDASDKGKVLQVSFNYAIASGTYADDDVTVWIYDVTNAALIQPAPYKLKNHTLASDRFFCEFQTLTTSTSYRLIFHVTSTSASAFTMKVDDIVTGPQGKLWGSPVTDWQSFTPTGSWTSNTTYTGKSRRKGDSLDLMIQLDLTGAPTATALTVNLPSGLSIDTSKRNNSTASIGDLIGFVTLLDSGTLEYTVGSAVYQSTTAISVRWDNGSSAAASVTSTSPFTFTSGDKVFIYVYDLPILGWSSSVQMSDSADTRVVSFTGTQASQAITGGVTNITFTSTKDTHAAWDGDEYVVQVPGDYIVTLGGVAGTAGTFSIYKNGSAFGVTASVFTSSASGGGSVTLPNLIAGDRLSVRFNNTTTVSSLNLGVSRISGPAQIAASETIAAFYSTSTARSITSSSPTILYENLGDDSHNAYNTSTGEYRVLAAGRYAFSGQFTTTAFTGSIGQAVAQLIYVNGVERAVLASERRQTTSSTILSGGGAAFLKLNAGDIVTIRIFSDTSTTLIASFPTNNYFSIHRIGL